MKLPSLNRHIFKNYRFWFWFIAILGFAIMCLVSSDYGLSNDEPIHQFHGKIVLEYFKGESNIASLSPIDSTGNLVKTFECTHDKSFRGMNFFGGFFDLLVNVIMDYFPNVAVYDLRHLINAIFGFLLFLFIGLTTKELAGWKTALLALLFAFLSPRLFGHSFANPKDIPFASLYAIGIYLIVKIIKQLPHIKWYYGLIFSIIAAIAMDIRISGLLLIAYLGMSMALWFLIDYLSSKKFQFKFLFKIGVFALFSSALSYFLLTLLWPYASTDILGPIKVLLQISSFSVFNAYEVFGGQWYNAWEIPYSYIPVWIFLASPPFIILGFFGIPNLFSQNKTDKTKTLLLALLLFFFLFPIIYIWIKHSNIYNGIRHLLFIFPPIIVIAALSWDSLLKRLKSGNFIYLALVILIGSLGQTAIQSICLHPYEALYFSPLAGNSNELMGKYETDYWGISSKEAVAYIANLTKEERKNREVKIKMYYGDRKKVTEYTRDINNLSYFPGNNEKGWDYEIVFAAAAKFNKSLIRNWPPKNSIHEIYANGLPLCAILKNPLANLSKEEIAKQFPSAAHWIDLSLEQYQQNNLVGAILSSKKALELEPNNALALNNLGASANALELYSIAEKYLAKSMEIDSTFKLARNNYLFAKTQNALPLSWDQCIKNSINSYLIEEYSFSVVYCKKAIQLKPNDAVAYNNLCSAYNAMEQYELARDACEKALQLKADFPLAKNNLKFAKSKLK